jgi:hypothetical protein
MAAMASAHDSLERAARSVAEQATAAGALVHGAMAADVGDSDVVIRAKMLRLELLNVKADIERELGQLVLDCTSCGLRVHWIPGLGVTLGHWAHREPAPHHEPAV